MPLRGVNFARRLGVNIECRLTDRAPLAINAETFTTQGFGQHVLTASRSVERAYEGNLEIDGIETSLFTHFLIRGLETGEAARPGEEQVTVGDLYKYVHRGVVSHTDKMQPQMWVDEGQGELVIARNPKPHQVPDELNEMLESDNWYVREGAVRILGRWLHTSDPEKRDLAARTLNYQNDRERDRFVANAIGEELQRANATDEEAAANESAATIRADRTERKPARLRLIAGFAFMLVIGAVVATVYQEVQRSVVMDKISEAEAMYAEQAAQVRELTVERDEVRAELQKVMLERDEVRAELQKVIVERDEAQEALKAANNHIGGLNEALINQNRIWGERLPIP